MKSEKPKSKNTGEKSRPARGGWIEISIRAGASGDGCTSRPARGGWIEIVIAGEGGHVTGVPPRTGRVD